MAKRDLDIALALLAGRRVDEYRALLVLALESGYRCLGVGAYWRERPEGKVFVLRHDVDRPKAGVSAMLAVERDLGVASTWYFRWASADEDLVRAVADGDGEAGLHYETLARVCRERGVRRREDVTAAVRGEALEALRGEIERFRRRFGVGCRTVASHGHAHNRLLRMTNNEIVTPNEYAALDIDVEAYDENLLRGMTYVCDAPLTRNRGWAYRDTPGGALARGDGAVCFLSHPHHWELSALERAKGLARWAVFGVPRSDARFARSYGPGAGDVA